jgi:7,8-dihydropterin-6-yl-methyl-4-(beta-D-ribofuranosyl)aminobenzene 5'-phosphate synthase
MKDCSRIKHLFLIILVIILISVLIIGCQLDGPAQVTTVTSTEKTSTTLSDATIDKPATAGPLTEATTRSEGPASTDISTSATTSIDDTAPLPETSDKAVAEWRLTILYDNNSHDPILETDWGFSCLIEGPESVVLFDTGADSGILLANMQKLELDPSRIDAVVLSHNHRDHVGGLGGFLEKNPDVVVYLPASFPDSFKDMVRSFGADAEDVSEARELYTGLYSTGETGSEIKEQSLMIATSQGLVIITGCAHPGIVNIVRKASDILADEPVYMVLGGFHLAWDTTPKIVSVIDDLQQLGVVKVAPCHCSGDAARRLFKEAYGKHYIESGAGKIMIFRSTP